MTLLARDLFPSGSAAVNPAYDATIQRLTGALNKVPGRVLVVGHTDDQPIRSLRYQDNFELSRERAVSVVDLLKRGIDNPARMNWTGVGASEPRYRPESDPRTARATVAWKSFTVDLTVFAFFKRRAFVLLIGFLLIASSSGRGAALPLPAIIRSRPRAPGSSPFCSSSHAGASRSWSDGCAQPGEPEARGAVLSQTHPEKERPSAEATKLRERFEESVAALTDGGRAPAA